MKHLGSTKSVQWVQYGMMRWNLGVFISALTNEFHRILNLCIVIFMMPLQVSTINQDNGELDDVSCATYMVALEALIGVTLLQNKN